MPVTVHSPIRVDLCCLSQQVGKFLRVKIKQVPVGGKRDGSSQFEWRLEEDAECPEQWIVGEGAVLMWDASVKYHCAFSPQRVLIFETVAAIPSTEGIVASLIAVGVGIMITAVLDVAWTGGKIIYK